ncbi:MAG TPA: CoA-binding protein, partial [Longimicrobiales bacterium]
MAGLKEAAQEFLSHRRYAVAGVSRQTQDAANAIYKRMRQLGYEVFPVNPNADVVEGDRCYASVGDVPGPIDGVVVVTHPSVAAG